MPPPPKKPAPPPAKKQSESFIGNDSATMMTEETFEEFEARMRSQEDVPEGATNTTPAHEASDEGDEGFDGEEDMNEDDMDEDDVDDEEEESSDDDAGDDDDEPEQKLGPGGRPLDRFGVEWDYVSHEGMGFNDDDDEDAMTFEKNGKTYFKPDWGKLRPGDFVKFWKVNFALEEAGQEEQNDDNPAYAAALKKYGFRNRNNWKRVHHCFMRHYAKDPEFTNAALIARQEGTRDAMRNAVKPGMLDPIEGVSLQLYASIAAQQMSVQGAAFVKLLAKHKLDEAKFARVSEAWMARMSDQSDPMAAAAIATEYGKAFAGGGVGQYGASAQEASSSMGINDKVAASKTKGGAGSMTFDKYVEVMTAQSCWAQQGKDVNQMLKKVFNMNAVDWSNASAYWSQKMSTDIKLMTEQFPVLQEKYTKKYMAGAEDPDSDLDV
ncbi:MAG: hypothetical protein QM817_32035 [Archangium sp.]